MSRVVIPPAYRPRILSSRPASWLWRLPTSRGSKPPSRSRGERDLDRPHVRLDRLAPSAVADVRALRHPAGRMPQMLAQLRPERGLDHPPRQLFNSPAGPVISSGSRLFTASASPLGNRPASRTTIASGVSEDDSAPASRLRLNCIVLMVIGG